MVAVAAVRDDRLNAACMKPGADFAYDFVRVILFLICGGDAARTYRVHVDGKKVVRHDVAIASGGDSHAKLIEAACPQIRIDGLHCEQDAGLTNPGMFAEWNLG